VRDTKTVSFSGDRGEITVRCERANCGKCGFFIREKLRSWKMLRKSAGWQIKKE